MWYPSDKCAAAIVKGGEARIRDVYYPLEQTYPLYVLRTFPGLTDFVVQALGFH